MGACASSGAQAGAHRGPDDAHACTGREGEPPAGAPEFQMNHEGTSSLRQSPHDSGAATSMNGDSGPGVPQVSAQRDAGRSPSAADTSMDLAALDSAAQHTRVMAWSGALQAPSAPSTRSGLWSPAADTSSGTVRDAAVAISTSPANGSRDNNSVSPRAGAVTPVSNVPAVLPPPQEHGMIVPPDKRSPPSLLLRDGSARLALTVSTSAAVSLATSAVATSTSTTVMFSEVASATADRFHPVSSIADEDGVVNVPSGSPGARSKLRRTQIIRESTETAHMSLPGEINATEEVGAGRLARIANADGDTAREQRLRVTPPPTSDASRGLNRGVTVSAARVFMSPSHRHSSERSAVEPGTVSITLLAPTFSHANMSASIENRVTV